VDDLWATKSEDVGLIVHAISFQDLIFNLLQVLFEPGMTCQLFSFTSFYLRVILAYKSDDDEDDDDDDDGHDPPTSQTDRRTDRQMDRQTDRRRVIARPHFAL